MNSSFLNFFTYLLMALMQITGSKVCSPSLHTPCGSIALSRRSSLAKGGTEDDTEVDGSPAAFEEDDSPASAVDGPPVGAGDGSLDLEGISVAVLLVAEALSTDSTPLLGPGPSVSSLIALKELDSQRATSGLMSCEQPSHCSMLPMRESDLYYVGLLIELWLERVRERGREGGGRGEEGGRQGEKGRRQGEGRREGGRQGGGGRQGESRDGEETGGGGRQAGRIRGRECPRDEEKTTE